MGMQTIVTKFIKEKQLLTQGATVLIAVSGGPDSMALLHYYQSIQDAWDLKLIAISVDHQLRGEDSKEDTNYVRETCKKWGIDFIGIVIDVQSYKREEGLGTQVAARLLRYKSFARQMNKYQADYLALGHHADDQIETMLMGFTRSSSTVALSGIPITRTFHTGLIVRPLLCVTKEDIQAYCVHHKIAPRIDQSNHDVSYTRNYFRARIIPLVKERNGNLHTTVQRLSESLQADEQFLQEQSSQMLKKVISFDEDGAKATFNIKSFKKIPKALQRRVYHLVLDYLYKQLPGNLSYVHEDAFFALLENSNGTASIDFPGDLQIERIYETVTFFFKDMEPLTIKRQIRLQIPGSVHLTNQSILTVTYADHLPEQDNHTFVCIAGNVSLPLSVRTRQPGDRMSWQGLSGTKKIKSIFIDEKIPRKDRDTWPIVVDNNDEILWLIGLRKSAQLLNVDEEHLYIVLKFEQQ